MNTKGVATNTQCYHLFDSYILLALKSWQTSDPPSITNRYTKPPQSILDFDRV